MTEPPQPPNQPPTPSGYGHLPGPPQPGYGYPPQGANPYAQQAPYGQQPAQQPGYGYPPPPPGPPGMPPAGPGANPKKKLTVVIAASVAAVLVLGTVAYAGFFRGGDEDPKQPVAQGSTPADDKQPSGSPSVDAGDGSGDGGEEADLNSGRKQGEDKVLWLKTSKIDGPGAGVEAKGQWVIGDTVVKTVWKSVIGYAVTDGKEKWKIDFPAEICGVTDQTTADGKTVITFKEGEAENATCNQMKMIDLKAGKEGWTKEIPKEGAFDLMSEANPSLTGDTVAINRFISSSAFKVSTGDKLFTGAVPEGCKPSSYLAGQGKMIALATCHDGDSTQEIQDADPVTGKKTWSYPLPKGWKVTQVYSVDPIVLDIGDQSKKERSIVVLGPDGKLRTTVSGEGSFASGCGLGSRAIQGCADAVVDAGLLYLPTSPGAGSGNEIVAFDLSTGKVKWRTPAGDKRTLTPLKAANGQLIAYREAEYDKGGEILTIPAAGGTPTAVLRHPSGPAAPVESSFHSPKADYVDGRFFISASRLLARGKDEKLLMVFGK